MVKAHAIEASFRCSVCGGVAARVCFVPEGVEHPLARMLSAASDRLVLGDSSSRFEEPVVEGAAGVRAALVPPDPERLYQLNPLWAPFYCPSCGKSYCDNHWTKRTVFDDDSPGYYDCTYGRCPQGHERIIDD